MNALSFVAHFNAENDYQNHLKEQRGKVGVVCKKCSGTTHY